MQIIYNMNANCITQGEALLDTQIFVLKLSLWGDSLKDLEWREYAHGGSKWQRKYKRASLITRKLDMDRLIYKAGSMQFPEMW